MPAHGPPNANGTASVVSAKTAPTNAAEEVRALNAEKQSPTAQFTTSSSTPRTDAFQTTTSNPRTLSTYKANPKITSNGSNFAIRTAGLCTAALAQTVTRSVEVASANQCRTSEGLRSVSTQWRTLEREPLIKTLAT